MWDQPSGWICAGWVHLQATECQQRWSLREVKQGKEGWEQPATICSSLGKCPVASVPCISARGRLFPWSNDFITCQCLLGEWLLMEVWRLPSSPWEPPLRCNCCATSHPKPKKLGFCTSYLALLGFPWVCLILPSPSFSLWIHACTYPTNICRKKSTNLCTVLGILLAYFPGLEDYVLKMSIYAWVFMQSFSNYLLSVWPVWPGFNFLLGKFSVTSLNLLSRDPRTKCPMSSSRKD